MDPNETLRRIDEYIKNHDSDYYQDNEDLGELMDNMEQWLSKKGFEPVWHHYPSGAAYYLDHRYSGKGVTDMKQPSKEQIEQFIKAVKELAFFKAVKGYEEDPDPDLVAVMKWLEEIADA